jgi:hypothetical protein
MEHLLMVVDAATSHTTVSPLRTSSAYSPKTIKQNKTKMKAKKGFKLRNVCNENIIVADGIENIDFSRIISMNETAAYLWKNIQEQEFDADQLVNLLLDEYEVSEDTARTDVDQLIVKWKEAGIIE